MGTAFLLDTIPGARHCHSLGWALCQTKALGSEGGSLQPLSCFPAGLNHRGPALQQPGPRAPQVFWEPGVYAEFAQRGPFSINDA